ncbi:hypothetical protein PPYR_07846 [Photinus pyralis]|uniref:Peptidase M13 N-terminal domain-containing protein n=1 Tax=Photinus pyralis TaxID=7054 RepID=A0A5N4ARP1_PHOPY|nr:neprilysin-2-like [Photinus pyralis]KAB0799966.1 hypothetical protein PPYR_07846 [Photinus pyralis]
MKQRWVILIIAIGFILSTLVVALIIHISFFKSICPDTVCQTPECIEIAAEILNHLDTAVNPCDNFYKFACGGFIKSVEISDDSSEVSASTLVNDVIKSRIKDLLDESIDATVNHPFTLAKSYYQVCMDTDSVEQLEVSSLHDLLAKIGGWPLLENASWSGKGLDWFYYVYKLHQMGVRTDYILKLRVNHDIKNTTFHILELDQPALDMPQNYFTDTEDHENALEEYRKYMTNVALYLGAEDYQAITQLEDVLQFEIRLANILEERVGYANITKFYNIMTVQDLETEHATIPWLEYINNIIAPDAEVTSHERILVLTPNYIRNLESLLQSTSKRAQINYIAWKAIDSLIPYLHHDLRVLQLEFKKAIYGITNEKPRWKECVDEVYKRFPIVISVQYVNLFPVDDIEEPISQMLRNIKMEYMGTIETSEMLNGHVKTVSLHKLDKMNDIIGYSPEILNDKKLEDLYSEVQILPNQYLQSFLHLNLLRERFQYKNLRVLKTRTAWLEESLGVQDGIYHNTFINTLTISPGVTEKNYYNKRHPNYLNYGGLGFEISREIARALFEVGQHFDDKGEFVKSRKKDSEEEIEDKTSCIMEQYGSYTIEDLGNKTINSLLTLENNIADNFGVKHTYDAYVEWARKNGNEKNLPGLKYTPVQLFWISFALNRCSKMTTEGLDVSVSVNRFAPAEFRVIGAISNVEDFSKDFECVPDSDMNPSDKCNL